MISNTGLVFFFFSTLLLISSSSCSAAVTSTSTLTESYLVAFNLSNIVSDGTYKISNKFTSSNKQVNQGDELVKTTKSFTPSSTSWNTSISDAANSISSSFSGSVSNPKFTVGFNISSSSNSVDSAVAYFEGDLYSEINIKISNGVVETSNSQEFSSLNSSTIPAALEFGFNNGGDSKQLNVQPNFAASAGVDVVAIPTSSAPSRTNLELKIISSGHFKKGFSYDNSSNVWTEFSEHNIQHSIASSTIGAIGSTFLVTPWIELGLNSFVDYFQGGPFASFRTQAQLFGQNELSGECGETLQVNGADLQTNEYAVNIEDGTTQNLLTKNSPVYEVFAGRENLINYCIPPKKSSSLSSGAPTEVFSRGDFGSIFSIDCELNGVATNYSIQVVDVNQVVIGASSSSGSVGQYMYDVSWLTSSANSIKFSRRNQWSLKLTNVGMLQSIEGKFNPASDPNQLGFTACQTMHMATRQPQTKERSETISISKSRSKSNTVALNTTMINFTTTTVIPMMSTTTVTSTTVAPSTTVPMTNTTTAANVTTPTANETTSTTTTLQWTNSSSTTSSTAVSENTTFTTTDNTTSTMVQTTTTIETITTPTNITATSTTTTPTNITATSTTTTPTNITATSTTTTPTNITATSTTTTIETITTPTNITATSTSTTPTNVTATSTSSTPTNNTATSTTTTPTNVTATSTTTTPTNVTATSTSSTPTNNTAMSTTTTPTNVTATSTSTTPTNMTATSTTTTPTNVTATSTSETPTNITATSTSTTPTNVTATSTTTTPTNVTATSTSETPTNITATSTSTTPTNITATSTTTTIPVTTFATNTTPSPDNNGSNNAAPSSSSGHDGIHSDRMSAPEAGIVAIVVALIFLAVVGLIFLRAKKHWDQREIERKRREYTDAVAMENRQNNSQFTMIGEDLYSEGPTTDANLQEFGHRRSFAKHANPYQNNKKNNNNNGNDDDNNNNNDVDEIGEIIESRNMLMRHNGGGGAVAAGGGYGGYGSGSSSYTPSNNNSTRSVKKRALSLPNNDGDASSTSSSFSPTSHTFMSRAPASRKALDSRLFGGEDDHSPREVGGEAVVVEMNYNHM